MKVESSVMGMPASVELVDIDARESDADDVFAYWQHVDSVFSTYKADSEIERINRGEVSPSARSIEVQSVLSLCEQTKLETAGYFDVRRGGRLDPSGLVKGFAIWKAGAMMRDRGFAHFYLEIGGDVEARGVNDEGEAWRVGIRNPFDTAQVVKVIRVSDRGVATSGTYLRGSHIYNPVEGGTVTDPVSLTVVGPNVYEADRFATAAFAMGERGIQFLQTLPGFEAYMIRPNQQAYYTPGFEQYVVTDR